MTLGKLTTSKPIEKAHTEIKYWLQKINVSGMDLIIQYDARMNVAVIKFRHDKKSYEFRSTKQNNCRLNLWAIARVMESKVRSHIMGIEDFDKSMVAYLQLEDFSGSAPEYSPTSDQRNYVILGISPLSSNEQIQKRYKELMKSFHPDMALSLEAKNEFEKRTSEINQSYSEIKKERGF